MGDDSIPRCKPLKYAYEKEIVMYAYFKKLHYFSTECIYSPEAYRGHVRSFLKNLEKIRPSAIIDIIYSGMFYGYVAPRLQLKTSNHRMVPHYRILIVFIFQVKACLFETTYSYQCEASANDAGLFLARVCVKPVCCSKDSIEGYLN